MCEPCISVIGYLEDSARKGVFGSWLRCQSVKEPQQLIRSLPFKGAAEHAGEKGSLPEGFCKAFIRQLTAFKVFVHKGFIRPCNALHVIKGTHPVRKGVELGKKLLTAFCGYVHLVYKYDHRQPVPFHNAPQWQGMALDAVCAAYDQYGCIHYTDSLLGLGGEILMPGGIKQCEQGAFRFQHRLMGEHSYAPFLFHLFRVKKGGAVVHPALPANHSRRIEK